ncbi:retrotransposon protein, putative, ty1-copia subclass, partial [Tanacetum coccineum]
MELLGYPMPLVLGVNLILTLLSKDYDQFIQDYNMHSMGKTIPELHAMLKLAEKGIHKKALIVLAIRQGHIQKPKPQARGKGKNKGKSKLAYDPKHKIPLPAKREHHVKEAECHHCHKLGHWMRNRPLCLAELKKNKASTFGTSAIEAIGSFDLILPSGMVLILENYYGAISIFKDNFFYFNVNPRYGIFEIDMHNHVTNERSIYTCSNKTSKRNLDSTFLWHCPLGHINKKRITKLQHNELLKSLDDESLTYVYLVYLSVARILNMVLRKKIDKTPYEIWHGKVLNLSYLKEMIGYYFYCSPEKKIFVARQDAQPSDNTSELHLKADHEDVEPQSDVNPVRISARIPQAPQRYGFYVDAEEHKLGDHVMNAEMQSMKDNHVWNLVDLPPNCKTIGSKWLFKKKTYIDGNIHTYNARLVTKGFTQTYRVSYEETFLPVADIKAIRILIAIVAFYDYKIWKMDVKTAFLNGYLNKDVYMVQYDGFVNPKHPRRVCKLQRSIYGLKQASRSWNKRFDEEIKKYGFTQNLDEPCVYMRASISIVVFLIIYVYDILLMGNNIPMLQDVKSWFGKCFAMKDLGEAAYILGIKIYRDRSRRLIGLSQNAYIDKILKRFKMDAPKRSIMYTMRCTKPDVAFFYNLMSRYQQNPGESQWTAMKNILEYLRNTKDMFLVYGR